MSGRIDQIFSELRSGGRRAVMPFVCGQHPRPGATGEILRALERAGAPIVEIGVPFSDPIADGPTIAGAMHSALEAGANPRGLLEEIAAVRGELSIGLVAMVSVSIAHRLGGADGFVDLAADCGLDGLIVPDLPLEASGGFLKACERRGLSLSLLVAPTTPEERVREIAASCRGFVYLLARAGITGEREGAVDLAGPVGRVRAVTDLPIAAGFGISSPAQVAEAVRHADAAIVGSALVRRISESDDPAGEAERFVRSLVEAAGPGASEGPTASAGPEISRG
ncbi:MAG: tryptophan synthase subunit alpha [Phycisphaerales bacterium]|nr:tryptophan synthase subunit alpha [Phycisphaerales bacterium]